MPHCRGYSNREQIRHANRHIGTVPPRSGPPRSRRRDTRRGRNGRGNHLASASADQGTGGRGPERRHDQGRRAALAVRNDGDQRDDTEGRHADADRRAEQERRSARKETGTGGCRSRLELAAFRREGAAAAVGRQMRRGVRLLDLGVAQIGAAGIRGAERHPVLSGAVRGPGVQPQCVLHRRRAEPAGDSGRRLPDGAGKGRALGARRHRLRLSAHHQSDPRSLSEAERRQARRPPDQLHAVRPFRLAEHRRADQEIRHRRKEDRRRFDDQR